MFISCSGVIRIWQRGGYGERAEREPIAEVPAESRGRAPGRGAETLFAFERSMEAANSPIFLKFGNAENHRYLRCFSKI